MRGPTASHERIGLLDAIRGVALVGILLANLMSFFGVDMLDGAQRAALPQPELGARVLFTIDWLVEGKFYSIFSMLLGIGFALQAARASRRGEGWAFAGFFRRRMAVLVAIGAMHMFLIWSGDILMLYGVLGLLLPSLARLESGTRNTLAACLFAVPLLTHAAIVASDGAWDPRPPFAEAGAALRARTGVDDRPALDLFARGSTSEYFAWNTANGITRPGTYLQSGRPAKVLALFLLGIWIGEYVLPRLGLLRRRLWQVAIAGAGIGLPASFVYASIKAATRSTFLLSDEGLLQTAAYTLGTTPLALAYMATATLAWSHPAPRRLLAWFVPLGRMALTVYLSQSVIALLLFSSHGLGWSGRVSIAWLPVAAAAILAVQRRGCRAWLARHDQGPVEWLWRRATYRAQTHAPV
ncbi:MAG: DUF418 domain-containing protein [Vicinamibacterales bacterium]